MNAALCTVFDVTSDKRLTYVCDMELPPRGVMRIAAVWPHIPEGGRVVEKDEWTLKIYDRNGQLAKVIV